MNKFTIIEQRINDLAPGQILSYFKFYKIQSEKGFSVFKNDNHLTIIIFKNKSESISFLETLTFKTLNKLNLFFFLINTLNKEDIINIISDIANIEVYSSFNFDSFLDDKKLINSFFSLEASNELADTILYDITYKRFGRDCIIFYKNEKPIDLVVLEENNNSAYSEFGNNFGIHFLERHKSEKLLLTYDPNTVLKESNNNYNVLITKYYPNIIEILDKLKGIPIKELFIPSNNKNASLYKLNLVIGFFNFYTNIFYKEMKPSPNGEYIELTINSKGKISKKIEVINFFSSIQNFIKRAIDKAPESIMNSVKDEFEIKINSFSKDDNHLISVLFRSKKGLIDIITLEIIKMLEKSVKLPFMFIQ